MNRKFRLIIIIALVILSLSACKSSINNKSDEKEAKKSSITDVSIKKNEPLIKSKDLDVSFDIVADDNNSDLTLATSLTNNSKYTVSEIKLTISLLDKDQSAYLAGDKSVKPGRTIKFQNTFGPDSKDKKDVVVTSINYTIEDNGEKSYVMYDSENNKYEVSKNKANF